MLDMLIIMSTLLHSSRSVPDMYAIPGLPASVAREVFANICAALPPRPDATEEIRFAREADAMAAIATLRPVDAFEARLAVAVVAADAHATESYRLAAKFFNDLTIGPKCRAQAALMGRQMLAALKTLQRMQGARPKTQPADPCTAPALADPVPADAARTISAVDPVLAEVAPHCLAAAEDFATRHPLRAARIRANGGLPAKHERHFTPPAPAIVDAIVRGTTPSLRALDLPGRKVAAPPEADRQPVSADGTKSRVMMP